MSDATKRGPVLAALLLGIFIAAMDNTIVATAMGSIVAHLGGFENFVWVTSAYIVTEMAGMPIFGKLSDMYGRKRFFVFGLIAFLAGSALCGTAHTIHELALYRALQGIGGGALMPIAFTIIFDVVPPDKAGKFSGMFGAVFGLSSIFGPLLGAYITEHVDWRWVFYINLPIGIIALALILFSYHESRRHERQSIDWAGAATLIPAIVCLMFGLEFGGQRYAWDSGPILILFAVSALLFAAFFYAETRARDPILSYAMFRKRLFAGSNLIAVCTGMAYIVAVVYIPIYIQGVFGGSAVSAGLVLLPMMLGSSVSAPLGGQLSNRLPYRPILLGACLVFAAGIVLLGTLTPDTPRYLVTLYMIVVGLGIGPTFSVLGMASMHHFDERQRGAASATLSFVRELSMAIGITVFGIVQRGAFVGLLHDSADLAGGAANVWEKLDPRAMLSPETRAHIPAAVLGKLTDALASSVAHTFLWTIIPAVLGLAFVFWMGRERWQGFRQSAAPVPEESA